MRMFRGGFDLDGVLALTHQSLFKELQARDLLRHRRFEEIRTWAMEDNFPGEISTKDVMDVFHSPNFWEGIEVCPFLLAGARGLVEQGVDLHIVTARSDSEFVGNMETITRKWLWYNGIPYKTLSFVPAEKKQYYCSENELDFFVEDRLDTAASIGANTATHSYLVDTNYNKNYSRVHWIEAYHVARWSRSYYQDFYKIHYRPRD